MTAIRVAIIGGGPGGLTTLKTLLEASTPERRIEGRLFEAEEEIGGTFKYRSYENAELVSSKQLTTFSDHRLPLSSPDHITLPQYVEYLKSYVDRFRLAPHMKLGHRVVNITSLDSKDQKWRHRVKYTDPSGKDYNYDCSHLAICTGLHVEPNIPTIPGIEHIQGHAFHSSLYKYRSQLTNRDILILGCGETAMDIAYESIKANAKSVTMCYRTGFLSFPKALSRFQVFGFKFGGGLPIDGLITNLFETAYVHRSIAASRLRWFVSDSVLKRVLWFLTGTQAGVNQHIGALPPEKLGRAYVFLNKSNKAMPYLNRPYKTEDAFREFIGNKYIDPPEDASSDRWIDTCTFPALIDETGTVIFEPREDRKDWQRMKSKAVKPDCVIYCTGYRQSFPYLPPTYPTPSTLNIRNILHTSHPSIAFIGFVRPGVGAIPPIAEQQAMWFTALITNQMAIPTSPSHYHLLASKSARIKYGVDHSAYMSTLARISVVRQGYLNSIEHMASRYYWYIVSAHRPFACDDAPSIAKTELAETITRRGVVGNLFFAVVPMMFYGVLNAVAWCLDAVGLIPEEKGMDVHVEDGVGGDGKM